MRWIAALAATASLAAPSLAQTAQVRVDFDVRSARVAVLEGLADPSGSRALTPDDPVRIASVSKLFVALGVLRLVDRGVLDLDADVSRWLGWNLRHPDFPDRPVTLRLLLSHRAGITDRADYVIPLGENVRDWLTRPDVWDRDHAPGEFFRYANLNFPVIATIMEAATHERFDRLMAREVFGPLGLDACFNWTACSDAAIARAVVLTAPDGAVLRDDLKGRRPPCPVVPAGDGSCTLDAYRAGTNGGLFSPQGGLRISANGLAKTGQMLLAGGRGFLSRRSFAALRRMAWRLDRGNGDSEEGFYCAFGLSVQQIGVRARGCNDDLSARGVRLLGHAGEAYGLRSGLWVDMRRRSGFAYFLTGLGEAPQRGQSAFTAPEEALVRR